MNNSAYTCFVVDAAICEQSVKRSHVKVSFTLLLDNIYNVFLKIWIPLFFAITFPNMDGF